MDALLVLSSICAILLTLFYLKIEVLSGGASPCYKVYTCSLGYTLPATPGGGLSHRIQNKILVHSLNLNFSMRTVCIFHITMQT